MKYARVAALSVVLALLLIAMGRVSPVAAQPPNCVAAGNCLGFPDADDRSGKFINVTRGLSSLGDVGSDQGVVNIFLIIPAAQTDFELHIFDGDMGGTWDVDPAGADQYPLAPLRGPEPDREHEPRNEVLVPGCRDDAGRWLVLGNDSKHRGGAQRRRR